MTGGDAVITTEVAAVGFVKWCKKHLEFGPHDIPLQSRVKATEAILCFLVFQSHFCKYIPLLVNLSPPVLILNIFQFSFNIYQKTDFIPFFAFLF